MFAAPKFLTPSVLALTAVALVGCGDMDQGQQDAQTNKIIGSNDLVKVLQNDESYGGFSQVIGAMKLGCTVTHLGNGVGVTAGHCVQTSTCTDDYSVIWGFTEDQRGVGVSKCEKVLASVLDDASGRDYAFIKYSNPPALRAGFNVTKRPEDFSNVIIFSHPALRTLETSGWCVLAKDKERPATFRHNCDTEGGSSGAAVLNTEGEVIGIHNAASGIYEYNIATYLAETPVANLLAPTNP